MTPILLRPFLATLLLLSPLAFVACSTARFEPTPTPRGEPTGFLTKSLPSGRQYGLFVPQAYSTQRKWPVIIFLHGIGEAGGDPQACMRVGIGPSIRERQDTFPFFVIFAQSHGGWSEDSDAARDVIAALQQVKHDYSVDDGCVTLTGLSTGGYGTWAIGARYKSEFSALVPMAAYSDHKDVDQLTDMPVWAFHNTGDPFVLAAGSHSMVNQINQRGGHAEYTEFFAAGHDCWSHAYSEEKLYNWMLQQRRTSASARRTSIPSESSASARPITYNAVAPSPPPPAAVSAPRPAASRTPAPAPRAVAPRPTLLDASPHYPPAAPSAAAPRTAEPPAIITPY